MLCPESHLVLRAETCQSPTLAARNSVALAEVLVDARDMYVTTWLIGFKVPNPGSQDSGTGSAVFLPPSGFCSDKSKTSW